MTAKIPTLPLVRQAVAWTELVSALDSFHAHRFDRSKESPERPDTIIISDHTPSSDVMIKVTPAQLVHLANTMLTDAEREFITHPHVWTEAEVADLNERLSAESAAVAS